MPIFFLSLSSLLFLMITPSNVVYFSSIPTPFPLFSLSYHHVSPFSSFPSQPAEGGDPDAGLFDGKKKKKKAKDGGEEGAAEAADLDAVFAVKKKKSSKKEKKEEGGEGGGQEEGDDALDEMFTSKKKKKSSKKEKKEEGEVGGEEAAEEDADLDAAFLGSKKKKKSKRKEEGGEEGAGEEGAVYDSKEANYSYDELLQRMQMLLQDGDPSKGVSFGRVPIKMPPINLVRIGTKKTRWDNFQDICKCMNRTVEHLFQFLVAELGTEGSIDGNNRLVLRGKYVPKGIESLLRKYIGEYVACTTCKSPSTSLSRDSVSRLYFVHCQSCGSSRSVAPIRTGFHAQTRADRRALRK